MKCLECGVEFEKGRKYCGKPCAIRAHRRQQAHFEFKKRLVKLGEMRKCFRCKESIGPREQGVFRPGKRLCNKCKGFDDMVDKIPKGVA